MTLKGNDIIIKKIKFNFVWFISLNSDSLKIYVVKMYNAFDQMWYDL